jgi:ABC-type phosphate/phosphonate transport system substrate-binding protein
MNLKSEPVPQFGTSITENACLKYIRILLIFSVVLFNTVLAIAQPLSGGVKQTREMPNVLRVGFLSNVFSNVDNRDAQVAMELWARELARGAGINKASVTLLNSREELTAAVRNGSLDIVTLSALDYLKLRNSLPLVPAFVASNHVGPAREQLLIVSRRSNIRTLDDLRGKTIDLLPERRSEPAQIWLETLLMSEGKGNLSSFFLKVNRTPNASQAIMHVFFGKVDAAIVNRGSFETTKTMNPQLGQQLLVIAESRSILGDVSCIPKSISTQLRLAMEIAAAHLHESAMGRQMAALFQIDRVIPYRPMYLDGLTTLIEEHSKLEQKPLKRN